MAKKPRVNETWLVQQGHKALELGFEHRTRIEPRLKPGLLDALRDDVDMLREHEARRMEAGQSSLVATATQNSVLADAYAIISALGAMLRRNKDTPKDVRKAYGVGVKIEAKSVSAVLAAGGAIVERADGNPEEARAFGVLDSDIETMRALLTRLGAADKSQEAALATRPRTTKTRNAAAARILESIQAIAGAGVAAFALEAELRTEFDALDDQPKRPRKKK